VAVSFIGGKNQTTQRKPPICRKSLTNLCIEYTSTWTGFELTTLVVIGTDCTCSCKSNYNRITMTTAASQICMQNIYPIYMDFSSHLRQASPQIRYYSEKSQRKSTMVHIYISVNGEVKIDKKKNWGVWKKTYLIYIINSNWSWQCINVSPWYYIVHSLYWFQEYWLHRVSY